MTTALGFFSTAYTFLIFLSACWEAAIEALTRGPLPAPTTIKTLQENIAQVDLLNDNFIISYINTTKHFSSDFLYRPSTNSFTLIHSKDINRKTDMKLLHHDRCSILTNSSIWIVNTLYNSAYIEYLHTLGFLFFWFNLAKKCIVHSL